MSEVKSLGIKIAVVDNGFIYIGEVLVDGVYYIITRCANVRKSGTERGLGQIAFDGPTKETTLDHSPNVLVPVGRMCHLMDVAEDKWEKHLR